MDSGNATISSPVTDLMRLSYCYDPVNGRYDLTANNIMRVAGVITFLGIATTVVGLSRQRRR